jgi:hypothetical protein
MGSYTSCAPIVTNCTFADNLAILGRGMACDSDDQEYPSTVEAVNCIFWDGGEETWNNDGSTITINYSDVQGGWAGGVGNIGELAEHDPLFIDPGYWDDSGTPSDPDDDFWVDGDYHLQAGSPCIDTASNNAPGLPETDLDGHARILCTVVDMGAYESGIGDYDCDDDVDLNDFAAWGACFTGPDGAPYEPDCEAFDFDYDGDVDLNDLALLQNLFSGCQ